MSNYYLHPAFSHRLYLLIYLYRKLSLYFKFIAHAIDAFHIIRQVGGNPELLSQIAYMIVDRFSGIVGVILVPYQIQEHFISEHPLWVQYEQSEDFKFLDRQRNYLTPHGNKALLQAEIQITFPDFRQWLICLRRNKILASKECCAWDISRNIASLIITNKLSQLLLLAGRKQSK